MLLTADQMRSLPDYFAQIPDPRRTQGRRHPLQSVLAIAAGAILCGMRGYKAISDWAQALGPKARERFRCRLDRRQGRRLIPSEYVIRDLLVRIDPVELDQALQRWNADHGQDDASLAIDGKTMCNAQQILKTNHNHWRIENSCHYIIDWNFDEDRSRIRTGYGPENITRLRRFAVGILKSRGVYSVSQTMRQLTMNVRLVFDYLKMTKNSCAPILSQQLSCPVA